MSPWLSMWSMETRMVSSAVAQPLQLGLGVLGDEIGDDDARVVQHHLAQRHAVGKAGAVEGARPAQVDVLARLDQRVEIRGRRSSRRGSSPWSASPRSRPRHRRGDRDSARPARRASGRRAAPARRGRPVTGLRRFPGDRRKRGWAGASSRLSGSACGAMRPTRPSPSRSVVMCTAFGFEAAGGEQLERAVVAQHVERADVGMHVVGDEADDLVEPILRSQRLRHGFAQLLQEARADR